jgi:RNA 2',3'-cyclic 3'-phosphodiesterase
VTAPERVRLFVALELPADVRATLHGWARQQAAGVERLRLVEPESLHVTLCFLGSRLVAETGDIATACHAAVSALPAPELVVDKALWLPPRRPRVLTVALTDDDEARLAAVQSALARALAAGGFYEPETRPFLAHVTVARVGRDALVRPRELPAPAPVGFTGGRVTLFASRLGKGPARYEALASVSLTNISPA